MKLKSLIGLSLAAMLGAMWVVPAFAQNVSAGAEAQLRNWMAKDPRLEADPGLMDNPTYLHNHPNFAIWLQQHPGAHQQVREMGAYDNGHHWHDTDWWRHNNPDWIYENHPEWVRNHPEWRNDGDWDDQHHWHDRDWWAANRGDWVVQHHPDWAAHHELAVEHHEEHVEHHEAQVERHEAHREAQIERHEAHHEAQVERHEEHSDHH
jgi:hypothetical protein